MAKDTRRRGDAARGGSDDDADPQGRGSTLWSNGVEPAPRTERGRRMQELPAGGAMAAVFAAALFIEATLNNP